MEVASLDSVRAAAEAVLQVAKPKDVLLNNAGVINSHRRVTVDGFEETLAANHSAPFLLTGLLLPALLDAGPGARIVNVASGAHHSVRGMRFDDIQSEQNYKTFDAYGRSKLANILYTGSLAKWLEGTGVTVNCLHPGAVATDIGKHYAKWVANVLHLSLKPFFRSPLKGAERSFSFFSSDDVAVISGTYFDNCKVKRPKPWAEDDASTEELWNYSEQCI